MSGVEPKGITETIFNCFQICVCVCVSKRARSKEKEINYILKRISQKLLRFLSKRTHKEPRWCPQNQTTTQSNYDTLLHFSEKIKKVPSQLLENSSEKGGRNGEIQSLKSPKLLMPGKKDLLMHHLLKLTSTVLWPTISYFNTIITSRHLLAPSSWKKVRVPPIWFIKFEKEENN